MTILRAINNCIPLYFRMYLKKLKIGLLISEYFWSIPYIIYFNIKHLPWSQARKLPIWLNIRTLKTPKGKMIIECDHIKPGMICIGMKQYYFYKKGISLWNEGTITFQGRCWISNETIITVYKGANLVLGEGTGISVANIECAKSIDIGRETLVGIYSKIMDTDSHLVIDVIGKCYINPTRGIKIGAYNWLGESCFIMKGTKTPNHTIVAANSVLNKSYKIPEYSCLSTIKIEEIVDTGYLRDRYNDMFSIKQRKIDDFEELYNKLIK